MTSQLRDFRLWLCLSRDLHASCSPRQELEMQEFSLDPGPEFLKRFQAVDFIPRCFLSPPAQCAGFSFWLHGAVLCSEFNMLHVACTRAQLSHGIGLVAGSGTCPRGMRSCPPSGVRWMPVSVAQCSPLFRVYPVACRSHQGTAVAWHQAYSRFRHVPEPEFACPCLGVIGDESLLAEQSDHLSLLSMFSVEAVDFS